MTISVGRIHLHETLVALAIYEGFYCTKFLVKSDLVEKIYNETEKYLMIPDIFSDKGLLGTGKDYYEFLSRSSVLNSMITFTKLENIEMKDSISLIEKHSDLSLIS